MGRLVDQVQKLTRGYVRKGGKDNRRQQAARMIAFAAHCESLGARSIGQVGGRHAIAYWHALRALSDATRYNHYRALVILWQLAGKTGLPPEPHASNQGGVDAKSQSLLPNQKQPLQVIDD